MPQKLQVKANNKFLTPANSEEKKEKNMKATFTRNLNNTED